MATEQIQTMEVPVRNRDQIARRIREVEETLRMLDNATAAELEKSFWDRRRHVMEFIHIEKKIHLAILHELKWVINA